MVIKKLKYKIDQDLSDYVDLGAKAENIIFNNNKNLEEIITNMNTSSNTNIADLEKKIQDTKNSIPTKVSELTNDSKFITKVVNDLENYYKKTETYTKSEIESLINNLTKLTLKKVDILPTENIDLNTIYLVPSGSSDNTNLFYEYIYISDNWEILGSTETDLSNYYTKELVYTKSETDNKFRLKTDSYSKTEIDNKIPKVTTVIPKANGTATIGTDSGFALGDHIHPLQTSVSGNAGTATKAINDSEGQKIDETYLKGLSINGKVITYTKGNNVTGTITVPGSDFSLLDTHPIGSVYTSTDETSPASLFGGTWLQLTQNAYFKIVTSEAGNTGGQSNHKIGTTHLPSHSHGLNNHTHSFNATTGGMSANSTGRIGQIYFGSALPAEEGAFTKEASSTSRSYAVQSNTSGNIYSYINMNISHTHSISGTTGGNSGNTASVGDGNAYYPYYYGVYAWIRTA